MQLEFRDTFGDHFDVVGPFFPGEGAFRELEFRALDASEFPE
jgi:hypothetical protein